MDGRAEHGRFASGNPGKPKGAKAARTLEGEAFARAWLDANAARLLADITEHGDLDQRWRAFAFFFEQAHGKARQRVDLRAEVEAGAILLRWGSTEPGDPAPAALPDAAGDSDGRE